MIGYYIHHQGRGHLHRAQSIARALSAPVTVLSSLEPVEAGWYADWVTLPRDDADTDPVDVSAHGQFHWVPRNDIGLGARMAAIAHWVGRARPKAVVVDVSIEVTAFVRLMGVPVVVITQPGRRDDRAHQLAYALADRIIAPWPRAIYDPSWLAPHHHKTSFVGAWSRFDDRQRASRLSGDDSRPRILVLIGSGGTSLSHAAVGAYATAHPRFSWHWAGLPGSEWVADPWPQLCSADVVISHAGQNALAEIAAARRPAIIVPEARPHGEQAAVARALGDAGIVTALPRWPAAGGDWDDAIDEARNRGAAGWSRWSRPDAVGRAAELIDSID